MDEASAPFNPQAARDKDAQATAVIDYAKRINPWPTLEQAVEAKMEDQAEFVAWWRDNVTAGHGGSKGLKSAKRQGHKGYLPTIRPWPRRRSSANTC